MAKRFDHRGKKGSHVETVEERRKKAATAQQEKISRFRESVAKRTEKIEAAEKAVSARPVRALVSHSSALSAVPFHEPEQPQTLHAGAVYHRLVEIALTNINANIQSVVLSWPNCEPAPAAIAAFLALADCGASAPIKLNQIDALSAPLGLRALIYPYARTSHRALRHIYVDKDYLGRLHLKHQLRGSRSAEDPALVDYHKTLARVKTLTGMAVDGKQYAEFRHPSLDEIMPSGPCQGSEARSKLLWNVEAKTDLKKIRRSDEADDPVRARFYLFGLRAADAVGSSLSRLVRPPDIVLVDLSCVGRNRLGPEWVDRVRRFFQELETRFGKVPAVVLTEDPWTFDKARFEVLGKAQRRKSAATPAPSSVILSHRSDIVEVQNAPPQQYAAVRSFEVISFSGDVSKILGRLRAASASARDLGDVASARELGNLIGIIRRCASLPASLTAFGKFIQQEAGSAAAADILSAYRTGRAIAELKQSIGPWAQADRSALVAICEEVHDVWSRAEKLTPMAPLLKDVLSRLLRASSRTAVLFEKDMLADFAQYALSQDPDIGESVQNRLDKGMLYFLDRAGLDDLEHLPSTERNHIKTLIAVSPARSAILALLARPWLPDKLIVLGDSESIESALRDASRLARYEELSALKPRMELFISRASAALEGMTNARVDLNLQIEPVEDIDIPFSGVVNLAGSARPGQPLIRFQLEGGQVILARPGTKLVVQDKSRTIPLFVEVEARDAEIGDRVCVIGDAFLEMARPLLNITARAAEEIRDYHRLVLDRFAKIPGSSAAERLAHVVQTMGLPDVTAQRAGYWLDLEEQLEAPLHEVVPHAPRDFRTFLAFMKALSVSDSVARRFWTWAVIAQRESRLRAAISFHDAYRGILVDNYAAQSDNPERVSDIRKLRAAAENFISAVSAKTDVRGEDAGA